jgi:hypothetical protein
MPPRAASQPAGDTQLGQCFGMTPEERNGNGGSMPAVALASRATKLGRASVRTPGQIAARAQGFRLRAC